MSSANSQDTSFRTMEYQSLLQEILENTRNIYIILQVYSVGVTAIFTGVVTIFGQILNRASTNENLVYALPFLLLTPLVLAIPSISLITSLLNSTTRIASYLRVAYDDDHRNSSAGWQKRLQKLREMETQGEKFRFFSEAILSLFNWTCWMSILLSCTTQILIIVYLKNFQNFMVFNSQNFLDAVVKTIIAGYFILLAILTWRFLVQINQLRRRFNSSSFTRFTKKWKEILDAEIREA